MDFTELQPLDRLSFAPWLPEADWTALLVTAEEQAIWRRVVELLDLKSIDECVPLQTPFSSLSIPAIEGKRQ